MDYPIPKETKMELRGCTSSKTYNLLEREGLRIESEYSGYLNSDPGGSITFLIHCESNSVVYCAFAYTNLYTNLDTRDVNQIVYGQNIGDKIYDEEEEEVKEVNTTAYVQGLYSIEDEKNFKGNLTAVGSGAYSSMGARVGQFLFKLQLLLIIRCNIPDFKLENYTDDQCRAARGIYKDLEVDLREEDMKDFVGKTDDEKLSLADGKMRYILKSDSEEILKNSINALFEQILDEEGNPCYNIWNIMSHKRNSLSSRRLTQLRVEEQAMNSWQQRVEAKEEKKSRKRASGSSSGNNSIKRFKKGGGKKTSRKKKRTRRLKKRAKSKRYIMKTRSHKNRKGRRKTKRRRKRNIKKK